VFARLEALQQEPTTVLRPQNLDQTRELGPEVANAAAVPAAGPGPAEIRLDQRYLERRILLVKTERGPEPGEPATDDADIGLPVTGQLPFTLAAEAVQRLLDPK